MRKRLLTIAILDALALSRGEAMPDAMLRRHAGELLPPAPSDDEWKERMDWLVFTRKAVAIIEDEIDETLVKYSITAAGRTFAATL